MIEMILLVSILAFMLLNTFLFVMVIMALKKADQQKCEALESLGTLYWQLANVEKRIQILNDQQSDYNMAMQRKFRAMGDSFKYISEQLKKLLEDLDMLTTDLGEDMTFLEKHYDDIYEQFKYIWKELENKKIESEGQDIEFNIYPPDEQYDEAGLPYSLWNSMKDLKIESPEVYLENTETMKIDKWKLKSENEEDKPTARDWLERR